VVDTGSGTEEVSVALVSAGIGDEILVHAKEAIAVLGQPARATEVTERVAGVPE
jgi:hydrogenase maturation factor